MEHTGTDQEAFNIVLNGIRRQGRPGTDARGALQFFQPNGLRCALALLVPELDRDDQIVTGATKKYSQSILGALMSAHDRSAIFYPADFFPHFEEKMREIAVNHNLHYTPSEPAA